MYKNILYNRKRIIILFFSNLNVDIYLIKTLLTFGLL